MSYTILTPDPTYTGVAEYGAGPIVFQDGEASVAELPAGVRAYMERLGYEIEEHEDGPYDPGQHTVGEVKDHLGSLDDSAEMARILEAEADGKGRKSILESFDYVDVKGGETDAD